MKLLACIASFALLSLNALAQGTIIFHNNAATLVRTNDGINSGPVVMPARVMLFYSTAPTAPAVPNPANNYSFSGWMQTTPTGADSAGIPLRGFFFGGTQTAPLAVGGSSPWVFVVGWTGAHADFLTAVSAGALAGFSQAWQQPTGDPNGEPVTDPVSLILGPSGFNGLQLMPVPEPSSIALAALGVAALLGFRRRK